jgi:hypothetical protein
MTQEAIIFTTLQGVLGILVLVGLGFSSEIRKEMKRLADEAVIAGKDASILHTRVDGIVHDLSLTDSRVLRIGERVSELKNAAERLEATISVCPSCPQPGKMRVRAQP